MTGDADSGFDDYYVKFIEADNLWQETVAPNTKVLLLDNTTMPHILIRTADGNFRFTQVDGSAIQYQELLMMYLYGVKEFVET